MNHEFSVLLIRTNFCVVAKLCSHQPLMFSFASTAADIYPKANCLINSPLNSQVVFGALLNSFLLPPHLLVGPNAFYRRILWFLSFFIAPAHSQSVLQMLRKCQYVFFKVYFILSLYLFGVKVLYLSVEHLNFRKSLRL